MGFQSSGLFFEDFQIGAEFLTSSRTVTESDVVNFAGLSGDFNQIHTDEEFARTTIYKSQIAHGLLGLSIVSGLADRLGFAEGTTIALRNLDWKFKNPIRIGDSVKAIFTVNKKKDLPGKDGGLVIFRVIVRNQEGLTVQIGLWSMLIKKKRQIVIKP